MQKHGGIWLALLLAAAVLAPVAAMASGTDPIPIDEDHFPDKIFRDYVKKEFDEDSSNSLSSDEIADVTRINVYDKSISDLTGIEHFTALTHLDCSRNNLTSLDVSGCTALTSLYCYNNDLTSLNVSGCTELETLMCYNNQLTSLDVSDLTALEALTCNSNQLTSLDVSDCTALTYLECYNNDLTSLNVSQNTKLEMLYCYDNDLTTLDASDLTVLKRLRCYKNGLTSLDVSGCTALTHLNCNNNDLTSLDVSDLTALGELTCNSNQLTSLDVSGCTELKYLGCTPQTARLGVNRGADGTWSANLAELIGPNVSKVVTTTPGAAVQGTTVAWSGLGVRPAVTYDFYTGFTDTSDPDNPRPVMMDVTLTLVPLGMGTEADVTGATVKNIAGVISGTEITVKLPAGSPLPTAGDIAVTLSPYAAMTTAPASTDGGRTWTFTVTSEDGKTKKNYTLYIVYGVTVESGEDDHGTVTASPNPARMGDTVTLTVTPDPGYMLTGWEVVLGDVTVREDNTFVMPSGAVILRPIFAPIPATPPQTGDDSHTGLWLALALVSLGGLCAAAYTARRRRGGAR